MMQTHREFSGEGSALLLNELLPLAAKSAFRKLTTSQLRS